MDKHREELVENYKDALFTLIMDDYAQAEGERLLRENEKLCNDPNFSLPEGMEERGLAMIRKEFRKRRRKSIAQTGKKVLSRVAMIVLVLNILFFVPFFTVDAFYVEVMNMMLEYHDTHTTVKFIQEDAQAQSSDVITLTDIQEAIPNTFILTESDEDSDGMRCYGKFESDDSTWIIWRMNTVQNTTLNIDTENADYVEEISVSGFDGLVVMKDNCLAITWGDTVAQRLYLMRTNLSYESAMDILENLYN